VILGGPPLGGTRIAGTSSFGTGFVDDMGAALAGCDLLCSLSGAESMNTSLLDALQLGVPFVAFDSGGAADFVESGRGGLLVPSGDAVAFGVAISSLVESELLRQKVGSHGPARAANFSVHMAAESTERCYHAALESRRAPIRKGASA
jgi:glycosyltransferase involved in cell wall biosynthesis